MGVSAERPSTPIVVLAKDGDTFSVSIEPRQPTGDHRTTYASRDAAWAAARDLWTRFKCGLRDDADPMMNNRNAGRSQPLENNRRLWIAEAKQPRSKE